MESCVDSYGVCNWYPEHGEHLVAESDRAAFAALAPAGKVFHCVGMDGPWLLLKYGADIYRASTDVFKKVSAPAFEVGQHVIAKGKVGTIAHISWHFKDESPIYFLAFDGRQSSRRYAEAELAATA